MMSIVSANILLFYNVNLYQSNVNNAFSIVWSVVVDVCHASS